MKNTNSVVADCSCKHDFQDERYGKGRRVHILIVKKSQQAVKRCTVCAKEKN